MEKRKKAKLFDIKLLAMDMGRLLFVPLLLPWRLKRCTPTGEKYRGRIRGGALVAANHHDFSDPLVMFSAFWYRRMFFFAGELVMNKPVRRRLIKGIGGIAIDRNIADMDAIRTAVGRMKEGHLMTIFPQGRLFKDEEVTSVKSGAVLMALQAGVLIYPMFIHQKKKWYHRRVVVIGDPIDPKALCTRKIPTTADIERISNILMDEMNRCNLNRSKEEVT